MRRRTKASGQREDAPSALNNRGVARQDKGDLDGAIQDYSEAIRLNADRFNGLNGKGRLPITEAGLNFSKSASGSGTDARGKITAPKGGQSDHHACQQ